MADPPLAEDWRLPPRPSSGFVGGILPSDMNLSSKITEISISLRAFGRQHPEIAAIYLFGSQALGQAGPLSDLDVAVLLNESRVKSKRRLMPYLRFIGEVIHACRTFDVDVVVLNEATPLLAYEVIDGGRLLYEADHDQRVGFEAKTVQHYLDLIPFYRVSRSYLKKQLLKTG